MDAKTLEALAGRVSNLERENRWLKRVGGAAIVGSIVLVALGTNAFRSPRELTAQGFVLNDASGRPRARLEMRRDGPALSLLSPERKDQVVLQSMDNGPSALRFFQGKEVRASLSDYPGIGPALALFDHNRHSKAEFFVRDDGDSGVTLHRYQRGVGLNLEVDGTSKLSFLDAQGTERAGMAFGIDGRALSLGGAGGPILGLDGREARARTAAPIGILQAWPRPSGEPERAQAEDPIPASPLGGRAYGAP